MSASRESDNPGRYVIVVKGRLDPVWLDWFDGLSMEPGPNDETVLHGQVADQAALHGVLNKIRDLGLPLVYVRRVEGVMGGAEPTWERHCPMRFEHELDAVLNEIMTRWGIPGLGIGIVHDGDIVYAKGFGVQSLETRAPVTAGSVFCVASVAKPFVATAVMQLAEQGRIDLDAPLVRYLPYFKLDDGRYRQITIRQMLSHTSGMPDMDETEYDELVAHPEFDDGASERYVRGLSSLKMAGAPGERFLYSNIAYNVLGDVIAKMSGHTFEAFLKDNVLRPAGMCDSTFLPAEVEARRLAVPHLRSPDMIVNPVYPYHRADAPASFLHTTVVDMCHWCITCLNRGSYGGRRILSPAGYDTMWTPVTRWRSSSLYENVGLGWALGHTDGVRTVSHGGGGFGWTAFLVLLPEERRGAAIVCNEESGARGRTVRAVIDAMLDREPQPGTVSWMVPIARALHEGGIQAACDRYAEIKDGTDYVLDEDDLVTLAYQLMSAGNLDLAVEVLGLNLHAFPGHDESRTCLAKFRALKSARARTG